MYSNVPHQHKIIYDNNGKMHRDSLDTEVKHVNLDQLREYVSEGREIEFKFNGKKYSITYGVTDGKNVISFCEFYQETTEVESVDELIKVERDGVTVLHMLESITEDDIWIY